MKNPIIEFQNYSFQYHAQTEATLHQINLKIYPGEKVLIVGPSGSGKSTLGHCLNGLIPFSFRGTSEGVLVVDGIETKKESIFELSKKIGTVLQDSDGQFVGLTVAEDIAFALENDQVALPEMKSRVSAIAKMVNMDKLLKSNPFELSGGQKQRVSLAGVLVDEVPILLFDEPLANLDPATGKTAIELIDKIHQEGKTIIIIEHRLEDVLHCDVDRIIVINEGKILMDDVPQNVLSSSVLKDNGIREPLYITSCKYAGIKITPELQPQSINTLKIEECASQLNDWYLSQQREIDEPSYNPLLEIEHLSFSYDGKRQILDDVSCSINKGEMISIVGKNGAGKSTLSKLIVGFEKEDSGTIKIKGQDIKDLTIKERAELVGIVLQNPNQMICENKIFDEIALGLKSRGLATEEIEKRVLDVMKICGLYQFRKWPISALSYGQKKRVTIASILVLNPQILILDEPTAGQDYHHYSEIMEFLKELNEKGQTILLITHDMHLMLEYTYRAIVLSDGIKIADKPAYEVLCDKSIIEAANLKETSLFQFAQKANIQDPILFVKSFIATERGVNKHEN